MFYKSRPWGFHIVSSHCWKMGFPKQNLWLLLFSVNSNKFQNLIKRPWRKKFDSRKKKKWKKHFTFLNQVLWEKRNRFHRIIFINSPDGPQDNLTISKNVGLLGEQHSTMLVHLLPDPTALGSIPSILEIREKNCRCCWGGCLEESG